MACLLAVLLGACGGDPGRGARIEGDEGDVPFSSRTALVNEKVRPLVK
jgi:hypothetical protein